MKKDWDDVNDKKLMGIVNDQITSKKHLLLRTNHMGSWPRIQGTTVTSTLLTAT